MPKSSITNILPISNSELTNRSKSLGYSWKTLAKAGLVFVTATGVFSALKAAGSFNLVSSWLKNKETDFSEQGTKLAVPEETEGIQAYSKYQRTGLSLTGFEPSEALQTDDLLQQTDPKESSLTTIKDSPEHVTFIPQRSKRGSAEVLEKVGPEFRVNTYTTSWQLFPSVAGLSDSKFVVTWESEFQDGSNWGVYGQMYNANGSKFLSEFQVNTYTINGQWGPSVADLSNGKFVVTWTSNGQNGSDRGVYSQIFYVNGTKYLSEFQVNTYTTNDQWHPSVAGLSNGKFVMTWDGSGQDGDGAGIYGQMFNADGSKYLSEFRVNTYTTGTQQCPSVAGLSDGKFVVTWESSFQDGSSWGVYGQMYNANGGKFLSEFQVNTKTVDSQWHSSVAGLSDGKFVVTWGGWGGPGPEIYGQMYNADSSKFLSEFRVNTYMTAEQYSPSIAGFNNGKFVVVWQSYSQDGDNYGIYGQIYNADGNKYSSEFRVNTYTTSIQDRPSVAGLSDGKFVVTWESFQDGSGYGVYGQMFRAYDSVSSSSQQVSESSSKVSNYSPTASSPETSSSVTTSSIESSSHSSGQSVSSTEKSLLPTSSMGSPSSSRQASPIISSHSSIVSSFETSSSIKPTSSTESISLSGQSSSSSDVITRSSFSSISGFETGSSYSSISSTLETSGSFKSTSNVKSEEPIYSDSIHDEGLSSGEITGIVLGVIASVGLCVAGGFFAVRKLCKSDRDQSIEDIELDLTIPKTFRCSLTGKMMNEPVEIAGERDRFYDREAIEQYYARKHKSPSGKSLKKLVLIPNYDLRSKIDEYKETLEPSAPQLEVD